MPSESTTAPSGSIPWIEERAKAELPERYFRELERAFGGAWEEAGSCRDFYLTFGGLTFRLRFPGDHLPEKLLPTLAHLQTGETAKPDYTICCWDDAATGSHLKPPSAEMLGDYVSGHLPALTNERFQTFYIEWIPILSAVDQESGTAYCCYQDAAKLPMYEISGPFRGILNAVLNRHGMQIIHASAVGTAAGSLLLAGAPFSGKSTLAAMGLQDGLLYQSDDLCVLSAEERPRSLCLYNILKLREDTLHRVSSLAPFLASFQEEEERKSSLYVQRHFPEKVLKTAPVRAVVLPRIAPEPRSELKRASPVEVIRGVMHQTVKEIPRADGRGESLMLKALSRIPAWHLLVGREERHTLELMRSLLAEA
jgi:hypothetical protein